MFPTTIVSCLYNIRKENDKTTTNIDRYLQLASEFIIKLPYPIIFFSDDMYIIDYVVNKRKELPNYNGRIFIFFLPFNSLFYYSYYNKLTDLLKIYKINNYNHNKDTVEYIILNNSKFEFIEKSIEMNPFQSTHFIWIDFGINHVAKNTDEIHNWILNIPDKIKQLCINPFLEDGNYKDIFRFIYHHTAGGLFSGSSENLLRYSELFKNKTEQIYSENWFQLDEAVMTIVQRENPELFDLYYGDYQGIICNYRKPITNISIIESSLNKSKKYNRLDYIYNICCYLIPFFKKEINQIQNENLFRLFIQNHLLTNDIFNNNLILIEVVYIINSIIIKNNESLISFLANNVSDFEKYKNKNYIISI